ncbi:hypothetical protein ABZ820_14120 [Streptomyces diacarni]|uniref:TPM domain-containing protein n=1 Tax=Streptomyces diacarni TaxID=2800381 RepID=A0A367F271_9ACTN|nr:hypothetical protein [Streptomyces diacarni]RCG23570.1 hypothetical protein DTL70_12935 [Streptomyces diacarni]
MKTVRRVLGLLPLLGAVVAALLLTVAAAAGPRAVGAAGGVDEAAQALRDGPVYVDPRARKALPPSDADALADRIERADKPVFVVVLPASGEFDRDTLLQDLRTRTGITGVYAVALGDRFDAGADSQVMSREAVRNVSGAVERAHSGDPRAAVTDFVDQAIEQAAGTAPASWDGGGAAPEGRGSGGVGAVVTLGALVLLAVGGAVLVSRRGRKRRERQERAGLEALRPVVDEDITAFGEELGRIGFDPTGPDAGPEAREDYTAALDAYEAAKSAMAKARRADDVRGVSEALERGRFALATLDARLKGEELPQRRPPCFFDPRHGPSARDVAWTPPDGGTERTIPVCAADATRLADGREPSARQVGTPEGPRPYWDAGPVYAPWAAGYFGGGLLPGMLMGTLLGSSLFGPYAYGADGFGYGDGGDFTGGDVSGGDFDSRDFGGGFGDGGGGFGGGDFGGGGGF